MSTRTAVLSLIQKGKSAMNAAFDNANEVVAKANNVGKKAK